MRLVPPRGLHWEVLTLEKEWLYFKIPKSVDQPNILKSDSTNEQN